MAGFIKLHRQITEHEFFKEPRKFSKFEAWLYILLNAKYMEETNRLYGKDVVIPAGSFPTSYSKLSKAWGWDRRTVKRFLDYLISEEIVIVTCTTNGTEDGTGNGIVVSLVNWAFYQVDGTKVCTGNGTANSTKKPVSSYIDKEEKNIYAKFVSMTEEEHQKLIEQFGEQGTTEKIESLNLYKGSTGKKYKSDYMTILSWDRKEKKQPQKVTQTQLALDKMM